MLLFLSFLILTDSAARASLASFGPTGLLVPLEHSLESEAAPIPSSPASRYLARRSRMLDPNAERSDGFSNTEFFSTFNLNMTEAITGANTGVQEIAHVMARLHAQQFPNTVSPYLSRAEACSHARLLVMRFVPESFEGIFSILKYLIHGLAQAAWSNRTFIWG